MNAPLTPALNRSSAIRALFWVGLTILLPFVAVALMAKGVASYFHLSSDSRALRNGLMEVSGVEWRQQIGLNIGGPTFGVLRAGLPFLSLDHEARAAMQAIRGAEVGIYELESSTKLPDNAAMLALADGVLKAQGWERVVGVIDDEKLVSVYLPANSISVRNVSCRVMVFDGDRMILVAARANLEPLLECLNDKIDFGAKMRSLARR